MFDYVLTGPISGVSAGQYIVGLMNDLLAVMHVPFTLPAPGDLRSDCGRHHNLLLAQNTLASKSRATRP